MAIEWAGGRTYVANGKTVLVIEMVRHGRRYTTPLDAVDEREALAELDTPYAPAAP